MGASESTSRSKEDEDPNNKNNSSMSTATTVATAAAGVAFAAWGISKMLSDNTDTQEPNHQQSLVNSPRIEYEANNQRSIWSPPPRGRFKMNTDGACHARNQVYQRGPSGYGGILRDNLGNWVGGFMGFIGEADGLTSEFHGILKGLELLDKLKLQGSILETDSQAAYQWVNQQGENRGKSEIVNACWSIIIKCRELIEENDIDVWLVKGDNANQCADKLAGMGIERELAYVEIKDCPRELVRFVEKDAEFGG